MYRLERRMFIRGVASLLALPAARALIPSWTTVAAPQQSERPSLKMLVLGDSVVWGQGLNEDAKFYTLVAQKLEQQLGRTIDKLNLSHSGASILPKAQSCPSLPGEVPIGTPTVYAQAQSARTIYAAAGIKPDEVKLVLLNGGINDVGFPTIVNPFTEDRKIIQQSKRYCFQEMGKLLSTLVQQFPEAHLVVTGYFPIISKATDPDLVANLMMAFFGFSKSEQILRTAIKRQKEQSKRAAKLGDENLMRSNWLIDRLTSLSELWKRTSDADLQAAVNAVNALPNSKRTGAIFVKVDFSPDECYAAKNTNLWRITGTSGGLGRFVTDDHMFSQRGDICRLIGPDLNARAKLICPVAGTGHPNQHGAKKYADAIMQKLTGVLAQQFHPPN